MDILQQAALMRAQDAISHVIGGRVSPQVRCRAFTTVAHALLVNRNEDIALAVLSRSEDPLVGKFVERAAATTLSGAWGASEGASLASAFLETVATGSILDQLLIHGRRLPNLQNVIVASGATGDVRSEGAPKVVRQFMVDVAGPDLTTAVALVVLTSELARAVGGEGITLMERELAKAVQRASNAKVLAMLVDSNSAQISGAGDPAADLAAGLAAAPAASAYIVAAPPGVVTALALSTMNKGNAGVGGGTLLPGLVLVPVEGADGMTIIAADRIGVVDGGLHLRPSTQAAVNMSDAPSSPSAQVSLFQTNCSALLVERSFAVVGSGSNLVVVQ